MSKLAASKHGQGGFTGYEHLMCPHCEGENFRADFDQMRAQPFGLYRARAGDLWKHDGSYMSGTGLTPVIICIGCEEAREAARRPGQRIKLVAFDSVTGESMEVDQPSAPAYFC